MTHFAKQPAVSFKKLAVFAFCIILAVVVVLGFILSKGLKRKSYVFSNGAVFYAYYTETAKNLNADSVCDSQKRSGGAGYLYSLGLNNDVCAFLYKTKEEAERIKQANITQYSKGNIIELKTTALTNHAQKLVKNSEAFTSLIHLFEDVFNEFYDLAKMLDSMLITESKMLTKVLLILEKTNETGEKLDAKDELSASVELLSFEIKDYLAKANSKTEKSSGIKFLCFKIIELFNASAEILNNRK